MLASRNLSGTVKAIRGVWSFSVNAKGNPKPQTSGAKRRESMGGCAPTIKQHFQLKYSNKDTQRVFQWVIVTMNTSQVLSRDIFLLLLQKSCQGCFHNDFHVIVLTITRIFTHCCSFSKQYTEMQALELSRFTPSIWSLWAFQDVPAKFP